LFFKKDNEKYENGNYLLDKVDFQNLTTPL